MPGRCYAPAVSPPHREFLLIFLNMYVSFHTHLFIFCRDFFRDCTAVLSGMKLIIKVCKILILVGSLWSREGVCPNLQP